MRGLLVIAICMCSSLVFYNFFTNFSGFNFKWVYGYVCTNIAVGYNVRTKEKQ